MLHLVADANIPGVERYFSPFVTVSLLPTQAITNASLRNADILLVRSVTQVDAALLDNTSIRCVGTPTSGFDHFDTCWLEQANITWFHAAGCNALSVRDYVLSCIAGLIQDGLIPAEPPLRIGIVGLGNVGKKVATALTHLGHKVLVNDPPRAEKEPDFESTPLEQFYDLDSVCLHTPLIREGTHPTFHLIEKKWLNRQKKGCALISAGRGAVVNFSDLEQFGRHLHWCLDVWEPEPQIPLTVMRAAYITTPHIAGHAIQGKWRGTHQLFEQMQKHFGWENIPAQETPWDNALPRPTLTIAPELQHWFDVLLQLYDPRQETAWMKNAFNASQTTQHFTFDTLRRNYPLRHELNFWRLHAPYLNSKTHAQLQSLGLQCDQIP